DRIVFLIGLTMMVMGGVRRVSPERRLVFSPIHLLLAAVVLYATLSALGAGTLTGSVGFYALLDRLGVIPFALFTLAPLLFGSSRGRNTLLVVLVVVGLYLGVTSFLEGVGLNHFVVPSYITNPAVGIHYGRARGPFVEAVANGLSMFMCAAAALVALTVWRSRLARFACYSTVVLSAAGVIFTLTRAVWLGAVAGTIVAVAYDRRLRRRLVSILAAGALGSIVLLIAVPSLASKAAARSAEAAPVWDRYNTNKAALWGWEQHPIFGIGWETFITKGPAYLREAGTYPLTGAGLEVHNVFLSHLVELGAVGSLLWIWALVAGVGGAAFRRGPPELYPWRLALIAMFTCFLVVANLGPLSYPFPNLMLWLWAGIVAADRYSAPRHPVAAGSGVTDGSTQTSSTDSSTNRAKSGMSSLSSAKVP
ncbi:MAG TPA: O-antigen ligase family protein, partial [Acidimicrobiales bacterium]|nr:O-antigen ligase family protein [Acidimicrobiales bacterium]